MLAQLLTMNFFFSKLKKKIHGNIFQDFDFSFSYQNSWLLRMPQKQTSGKKPTRVWTRLLLRTKRTPTSPEPFSKKKFNVTVKLTTFTFSGTNNSKLKAKSGFLRSFRSLRLNATLSTCTYCAYGRT